MDPEKAIAAANQYGIATVLCILMIGVLCWVLKWVFDTSSRRETALANIINTGLTSLTASISDLSKNIQANTLMIQEVARNMKDGFDAVHKLAGYQRDEHKEILEKMTDGERAAEAAREKIINAISDGECRAPGK